MGNKKELIKKLPPLAGDKYRILTAGNQFKMCGNSFRIDTYRNCDFGCKYCFANARQGKFGETNKQLKSLDTMWLRKQFEKAFDEDKEYKDITIELLKHRVPLHMGGLADMFQSREWKEHVTYDTIKICNEYNYPIMFSTKVASLPQEYWDILDPKLHAFQISLFSNDDKYIRKYETNTPSATERIAFMKELHEKGFWVGLRIQPMISLTHALALIEECREFINYITVEHLKIAGDNMVIRKLFTKELEDLPFFKASGRNYELAYEVKEQNIKRIKEVANGIPVGCGDNDLHHLTDSRCCCGVDTINENFNNWIRYNQTYFITGEYNKDEIWRPQSNCKKCLNGDAVKKDMYLWEEYVDEYMDKFPSRMESERRRGKESYKKFLFKEIIKFYDKPLQITKKGEVINKDEDIIFKSVDDFLIDNLQLLISTNREEHEEIWRDEEIQFIKNLTNE